MALDRQSIEKKDFPVGRRGYDPEAVDAHLAALAEEVSEFKRTARRRADTLASSASEQVRAIVEAAENSAADIQRDAETEARDIRDEANREAQSTRERAASEAREYVGKVSESTSTMLERVDSMEKELDAADRVAAHGWQSPRRRSRAAGEQPDRDQERHLARSLRARARGRAGPRACSRARVRAHPRRRARARGLRAARGRARAGARARSQGPARARARARAGVVRPRSPPAVTMTPRARG